jgi:hypothetical protein
MEIKDMYKKTGIGLAVVTTLLCANSAFAKSEEKKYAGFNYSQVGMQSLTYKETLKDFARIGTLETEFEVNNLVLTAASYTHLFDNIGFLLSSQSNLVSDIAADSWKLDDFGELQTNDSKIALSDLQTSGVWHLNSGNYLLLGAQVKTLNFTRSNIEQGEDADEYNRFIREESEYAVREFQPIIRSFRGAIQEDLTYLNAIVGVGYNSLWSNDNSPFYYFYNATASTPLYYIAQNTSLLEDFGIEEITGSFNGVEVQANAGVGFEMVEGIAFSLTMNYSMAAYDEINTKTNFRGESVTAAIPNVDLSGYQITLGITWIN